MASGRQVALALGAGGARGYAHAGVVEILQERGYEVVGVSGTSMGALVGGFVAAGRLPQFTEWARGLRQRDVMRLVDAKLTTGGAMVGNRLLETLTPLLGEHDIERLPMPYTAVATDLLAAREVWFQRGPLLEAIRASIAIPGAITPALVGGRLLADGGLLNPLPLDPLAAVNADLMIAVSLQGPRPAGHQIGQARPAHHVPARVEEARAHMLRTLRALGPMIARRNVEGAGDDPAAADVLEAALELDPEAELAPQELAGLRVVDAMSLSLDAMQQLISRYRLAAQSPDLMLTVPVTAARTMDFHRASEVIDIGRAVATEGLDRLEAARG